MPPFTKWARDITVRKTIVGSQITLSIPMHVIPVETLKIESWNFDPKSQTINVILEDVRPTPHLSQVKSVWEPSLCSQDPRLK
jgi:hypothetical protein